VQAPEGAWLVSLGLVAGNLMVLGVGISMRRAWVRSAAKNLGGSARFRFDESGFELETPRGSCVSRGRRWPFIWKRRVRFWSTQPSTGS